MLNKMWRPLYWLLRLVALALLAFAFAQALPFDLLAIVVAGDMLTYLEIATAVWLAAQVTRVKWMATYVRLAIRPPLRRARLRARRAIRRVARLLPSPGDDGRPRPAFA